MESVGLYRAVDGTAMILHAGHGQKRICVSLTERHRNSPILWLEPLWSAAGREASSSTPL